MKKHLIAAAVAAAVTAPAMAQNVTLYGTIDAGIAKLSNVGAPGNTGIGTTGQDATVYTDGAMSSSVWGMRGSEDLGGGLRAIFNIEGDLSSNNGLQSDAGIFRRATNVGLAGSFGTVEFGLKLNPVIAINGALMTTAGNSVSTMQSAALGFSDFFTRNAITYTSPNLSGMVIQYQAGLSNTAAIGGAVNALSLTYASGPIEFRFAAQDREGPAQTSGAHNSANIRPAGLATGTAGGDKRTMIGGVKLNLGAWQLGAAMYQNEFSTAGVNAMTKRESVGLSASYQMNPATRIGVARMESENSVLTHLQARYTLSKRSQVYGVWAQADNKGVAAYWPYASNTNAAAAPIFTDGVPGQSAALNAKQSGVGVGIIHSF